MSLVKKWLLRIVGLILFFTMMLWASWNSDPVQLNFMDLKTEELPVSLWIVLAFMLGVFTGLLMNAWTNTRLKMEVRKARKDVEKGHKELDKVQAKGPVAKPQTTPVEGVDGVEMDQLLVNQEPQAN